MAMISQAVRLYTADGPVSFTKKRMTKPMDSSEMPYTITIKGSDTDIATQPASPSQGIILP